MNLTTKQAAQRLNCSRQHITRMLNDGGLKGFKLGTHWRVPLSSIQEIEACDSSNIVVSGAHIKMANASPFGHTTVL